MYVPVYARGGEFREIDSCFENGLHDIMSLRIISCSIADPQAAAVPA